MRRSTIAASLALACAAVLGGVAACSGRSETTRAASSDGTTTSLSPAQAAGASTTLAPATGETTSTTKKPSATSSTIAYFTLPPSTTAEPPGGGDYEPGESVGRRFVDAVMDGNKGAATPLATAAVIKEFEPWKPYARTNDQGVPVPDYRYSGSTRRGSFNATLKPTVFVHCTVDTGKVTACSFGE